jgi:hypothetical protein
MPRAEFDHLNEIIVELRQENLLLEYELNIYKDVIESIYITYGDAYQWIKQEIENKKRESGRFR